MKKLTTSIFVVGLLLVSCNKKEIVIQQNYNSNQSEVYQTKASTDNVILFGDKSSAIENVIETVFTNNQAQISQIFTHYGDYLLEDIHEYYIYKVINGDAIARTNGIIDNRATLIIDVVVPDIGEDDEISYPNDVVVPDIGEEEGISHEKPNGTGTISFTITYVFEG